MSERRKHSGKSFKCLAATTLFMSEVSLFVLISAPISNGLIISLYTISSWFIVTAKLKNVLF